MFPLCVLPAYWLAVCVVCGHLFGSVSLCGGVWLTDQSSHLLVAPGGPTYSTCAYNHGKTLQRIPEDVRADTGLLELGWNELHDESVNMSTIRRQVPHLLGLSLAFNHLTQMPADLNLFNDTLAYLNLDGNRLTSVDFDYFYGFSNLRTLILYTNQITTLYLSQPITVVYIYLNNNKLTSVDMNLFIPVKNVFELHIATNPLVNLTCPHTPHSLDHLHVLSFGEVPSLAGAVHLHNLDGLAHLIYVRNQLTVLDLYNFTRLPELFVLYLGGNLFKSITSMPSNITLPKLQHLFLDSCGFEGEFDLTFLASDAVPILHNLWLSGNHITSLSLAPGHSLTYLRYLHLENNKILQVDLEFYIRSAPILLALHLQNNAMTQVTFPANGTYHPTLNLLDLGNNSLTSVPDYCLPSFTGSHTFTISMNHTHLRCDACLLWLVTCPYNVYIPGPVCTSPVGLKGKTIASAAVSLIDTPCDTKAGKSIFVKNTADLASQPVQSVRSVRGRQACAHRASLTGMTSFTYEEASQTCHMYNHEAGQFTVGGE